MINALGVGLPACRHGNAVLGSEVHWVGRLGHVCVKAMATAMHSKGPAESVLVKSAPLPDESCKKNNIKLIHLNMQRRRYCIDDSHPSA